MQYVPKFVREATGKMARAAGTGFSYLAGHRPSFSPAYASGSSASTQTAPNSRGYSFASQRQPDDKGSSAAPPGAPTRPSERNGTIVEYPTGNVIVTPPEPRTAEEIIEEALAAPAVIETHDESATKQPWYQNKWTYIIGAPAVVALGLLAGVALANTGNKNNVVTPPATPVATATYTPVPAIVPPVETTPVPTEDPLLALLPANLRSYFTEGGPSGIDATHRAALATYMTQLNGSSPDEATKFLAFYAKNPQLVESIKPEYLPFMTRLAEAEPLFTQDGDSVTPDGLGKTMIDITTPMGRVGSPIDNLTEAELQQYIKLVAENAAARGRDIPDDPLDGSLGVYDISKHGCTYAGGCGFTWETVKKNLSALPAMTTENKAYLANPNVMLYSGILTPVAYVKDRARGMAFPNGGNQLQGDIDILWNNGSSDMKDVIKLLGKSYDDNLDHPDFASYLDDIYSKALGLPVHVVSWGYPGSLGDVTHASIGINPDDYPRDKNLLEKYSNKMLLPIGSLEMGLREDDAIADGVPEMVAEYGIYWTPPKNNQ